MHVWFVAIIIIGPAGISRISNYLRSFLMRPLVMKGDTVNVLLSSRLIISSGG